MYMCVFVCDNKSEYDKQPHISGLSNALLHKTDQCLSGTKLPTLDMCRFIISVSKTAHQMRSLVRLGTEGNRGGGRVGQNFKQKGGGQLCLNVVGSPVTPLLL